MNRLPDDASLGEIWRSQQRTEQSIASLNAKLDSAVSKHEFNQLATETKSRLVAGEIRLNEIELVNAQQATNLKQLSVFTGWFGSAFAVALVGAIFTYLIA